MNVPKKLLFPILMFLVVVLSGIFGYMSIEGWDLLDSLYMTIITLSTVGYGEVREIGPGGRVFTVFLIIFGLFTVTYIVGLVAETLVESEIRSIFGRKKLSKKIKSLKNHYIICGYGRIGRIVCKELIRNSITLVVIEKKELGEELERNNILHIINDATHEDSLIEAGVEKAKGLVSVLSSDPENVYVSLTARSLNPDLFILSRAEHLASEAKLLAAGANKVILPYSIGARRIAQAIIRPMVTNFFELAFHDFTFEFNIEEMIVGEESQLNNFTLGKSAIRQEMDVIIIGIKEKDGEILFNPSSRTKIKSGDILIAMGRNKDLERLRKALNPSLNGASL